MPDPLDLRLHHEPHRVTLSIAGEIDMATVGDLQARIEQILDGVEEDVVVDLGGVTFIDSSGLNALATLHRALAEQNRKLRLRGLTEATRRPFEVTHLLDLFDVE